MIEYSNMYVLVYFLSLLINLNKSWFYINFIYFVLYTIIYINYTNRSFLNTLKGLIDYISVDHSEILFRSYQTIDIEYIRDKYKKLDKKLDEIKYFHRLVFSFFNVLFGFYFYSINNSKVFSCILVIALFHLIYNLIQYLINTNVDPKEDIKELKIFINSFRGIFLIWSLNIERSSIILVSNIIAFFLFTYIVIF